MGQITQLTEKESDFLKCCSKGDYINFCEKYYKGLIIDVAIDSRFRESAKKSGVDLRNYCTFYFENYSIGKIMNVLEYACILLIENPKIYKELENDIQGL